MAEEKKLSENNDETETEEEEQKILSQTLNAKSNIYVQHANANKDEKLAKQSDSGITAKLRLTNKSLTVYYPQPIMFEQSATEKSKGSRLATDMALSTKQDEIIFATKLSHISATEIVIDNKPDNVKLTCLDSSQCILTLSKWSAKSLHEQLQKLGVK